MPARSTARPESADRPPTDLLLLNTSNFERNPIFPYAFVQVRALARARGLSVATYDFLGVEPARYHSVVSRLIERHRPRMVGVTLRQADSIVHAEYACHGWKPYFPVENTQALIAAVREESDAPVIMGGFGFTTHAPRMFEQLRPDLGIEGEPDVLFDRFEDVLQRRGLDRVDNLLYHEGNELRRNPRVNHPPFGDREYDDEVVAELEAFYGRRQLYGDSPPSVAVELARGCLFRCEFCTEPRVKGRKFRQRDLDVVLGDVEFLARRGLRRFFMVCSEINMGSPTLALEVAERFLRLNETLGGDAVHWHAYHLPRWFSRDDLELLFRSGFAGGWNDFPSFDDENLVRLRVPYRARHILEHVKTTLELEPPLPQRQTPYIGLFLGNSHAGPATIARSLKAFNDTGLSSQTHEAHIAFGTRLFPVEGAPVVPEGVNATTYTSQGISERVDPIHPTFYLAPALEATLGSAEDHREFFEYAASTLFSVRYRASQDWSHFLATSAPAGWIARQLSVHRDRRLLLSTVPEAVRARVRRTVRQIVACDTGEALEEFLRDPTIDELVRRRTGAVLVALASHPVPPLYLEVLDHLGLSHDDAGRVYGSSYDVLATLLSRFGSVPELISHVECAFGLENPSRETWLLRRLLFEKNVALRPEYRPFLLVPAAGAPE